MSKVTIDIKDFPKVLKKGLERPLKNTILYMSPLATGIDQDTKLTFKFEGNIKGRKKWKPFSPRTLKTPAGTWRIRYGTDKKPLAKDQLKSLRSKWGFGHIGYMRKNISRYSERSKLLQSSGLYRDSFQIRKVTKNIVEYSTNHKLRNVIGSNPRRKALQFTIHDKKKYTELWHKFLDNHIKFK